jgi:20S proteasome subunit alpha 4
MAIGKNSDKVKEFLESHYKEDLDLHEALRLIVDSVLEYVESGSKNLEISFMRKGKQMEQVSEDEIDRLCALVEEEKKKKEEKK